MLGAVFTHGGAEGPVSLLAETYGTEQGSGTAEDITDAVKLEPALLWDAGYQETALCCQFGWEPQEEDCKCFEWRKLWGLQQVSANPRLSHLTDRSREGHAVPAGFREV